MTETVEEYVELGRQLSTGIISALPADWTFAGKDVLDFGSGAGRVLRHLVEPASDARSFIAADTDRPSIEWLAGRLQSPFAAVLTAESPPLPFPDKTFDLVFAVSVFTHLPDTWWPWLHELRRVSRPGSYVLLSFQSKKPYEAFFGEPFVAEEAGFVVGAHGATWDLGGLQVFHAAWWIEKMWGAVFDIDAILVEQLGGWQSLAVLRTPEGFRPAQDPPHLDPQTEVRLLRTNLRLARNEAARLRAANQSVLEARGTIQRVRRQVAQRVRPQR